ncbi:MAG TPA: CapA family protein [Gammaproteobacteria bacterium]
MSGTVSLFLAGDVMTGRGIDQVLPTPSEPTLYEPYVRDARVYVELAERVNGPIPAPVPFDYAWGDALAELDNARPQARIVNLETSITAHGEPWPHKGIHYRMHPANVACLTAARLDCCVLANNHVLDWGYAGLEETLRTLETAGVATAGAGADADAAAAPAVIGPGDGRRVLVIALAEASSGVPAAWAAGPRRPGVSFVPALSAAAAEPIVARVERQRRPGDVVVVSVHCGGNWGYAVERGAREFAHALIDAGAADVVHGHSSHHAKAIEVYRRRPILYGCGDFLNDYEGITAHVGYRADLPLMYLVTLDAGGELERLEVVPFVLERFSLRRAPRADTSWVRDMLTREGAAFGTRAEIAIDGRLLVRWD